jgi:hypothetical protein
VNVQQATEVLTAPSGSYRYTTIREAQAVLLAELASRGAVIERVQALAAEAAVEQEMLWPDQVIAALDGDQTGDDT